MLLNCDNVPLCLLQVRFRLVMFRPFVGEVISARLKESTKDGLRCMTYNCLVTLFWFVLSYFVIFNYHYDRSKFSIS